MVVLNSLDGLLTAYCIHKDIAKEANPIMGWLLNMSPWVFLFVKLIPVNIFIYWVATHKKPTVQLIVSLYSLVFLYLVLGQTLIILEAYARDIL